MLCVTHHVKMLRRRILSWPRPSVLTGRRHRRDEEEDNVVRVEMKYGQRAKEGRGKKSLLPTWKSEGWKEFGGSFRESDTGTENCTT